MGRIGTAAGGAPLRNRIHLAFDDGVPQGSGRLAGRARPFFGSQHGAAARRRLSGTVPIDAEAAPDRHSSAWGGRTASLYRTRPGGRGSRGLIGGVLWKSIPGGGV